MSKARNIYYPISRCPSYRQVITRAYQFAFFCWISRVWGTVPAYDLPILYSSWWTTRAHFAMQFDRHATSPLSFTIHSCDLATSCHHQRQHRRPQHKDTASWPLLPQSATRSGKRTLPLLVLRSLAHSRSLTLSPPTPICCAGRWAETEGRGNYEHGSELWVTKLKRN